MILEFEAPTIGSGGSIAIHRDHIVSIYLEKGGEGYQAKINYWVGNEAKGWYVTDYEYKRVDIVYKGWVETWKNSFGKPTKGRE